MKERTAGNAMMIFLVFSALTVLFLGQNHLARLRSSAYQAAAGYRMDEVIPPPPPEWRGPPTPDPRLPAMMRWRERQLPVVAHKPAAKPATLSDRVDRLEHQMERNQGSIIKILTTQKEILKTLDEIKWFLREFSK